VIVKYLRIQYLSAFTKITASVTKLGFGIITIEKLRENP